MRMHFQGTLEQARIGWAWRVARLCGHEIIGLTRMREKGTTHHGKCRFIEAWDGRTHVELDRSRFWATMS
jgi:hypothetical protein